MKKAALATAVISALASTSSIAATVFENDTTTLNVGGRMEFRGDFGDAIDGTMKNASRVRLNIGGETKLNDSMTGFGFYEAQQSVVDTNDTASSNTEFEQRYMYTGVKGDFGAISFGRQDTAANLVSSMSDLGIFTDNQSSHITAASKRTSNVIAYGFSADALTINASFVGGSSKTSDGYGIAATYDMPFGLTVGLGYAANDNGKDDEGSSNGSSDQIIAGLKYSIADFTIAGTYAEGDKDDKLKSKYKSTEVAAEYKLNSSFRLIAAYVNQEEKANSGSKFEDKKDFYEFTGRYDFSRNMRGYVAYKNDKMKGAKDSIRLGLRYDF